MRATLSILFSKVSLVFDNCFGQSCINSGSLTVASIFNVILWENVESSKFYQYEAGAVVSGLILRII